MITLSRHPASRRHDIPRAGRPRGARRRVRRAGFTLVEVLVALTILSVVALGMGRFMTRFVKDVGSSARTQTASELAADRLETIKTAGKYDSLEVLFVATETSIPNRTGFTRKTTVQRVGGAGQNTDYKRVTVEVTGVGLNKPVRKTTVVSAY